VVKDCQSCTQNGTSAAQHKTNGTSGTTQDTRHKANVRQTDRKMEIVR
jgi:hypothetical protein